MLVEEVVDSESETQVCAVDVETATDSRDRVVEAAEATVATGQDEVRLDATGWDAEPELGVDAVKLARSVRAPGRRIVEERDSESRSERQNEPANSNSQVQRGARKPARNQITGQGVSAEVTFDVQR